MRYGQPEEERLHLLLVEVSPLRNMPKTIGDHAVEYCIERGLDGIAAGDLSSIGDIAERSGVAERNTKNPHPLNRRDNVLDGLERDDRFEKYLYRGMDAAGRERRLRAFELKESAR